MKYDPKYLKMLKAIIQHGKTFLDKIQLLFKLVVSYWKKVIGNIINFELECIRYYANYLLFF